jgi:hypothetical protein
MANPLDRIEELRKRRDELRVQLAAIGDLRPGSLVERFRRCGKVGCHCAREDSVGHGPSWSLTREVAGKTVTRVVPSSAVERTREQLAEHRRFRGLARELVEVSEQLCEALLNTPGAVSEKEAAKKGGSRRSSTRRSSPSSKRS